MPPRRQVLRKADFKKAKLAEKEAKCRNLLVYCGICGKLKPWTEINFQDWVKNVWTAECNKCHGLGAENN
jgi:hypothetical protein